MKKSLIAIAFMAASMPMMFAQAPPPAGAPEKPAAKTKVHKHKAKKAKKTATKPEPGAAMK